MVRGSTVKKEVHHAGAVGGARSDAVYHRLVITEQADLQGGPVVASYDGIQDN